MSDTRYFETIDIEDDVKEKTKEEQQECENTHTDKDLYRQRLVCGNFKTVFQTFFVITIAMTIAWLIVLLTTLLRYRKTDYQLTVYRGGPQFLLVVYALEFHLVTLIAATQTLSSSFASWKEELIVCVVSSLFAIFAFLFNAVFPLEEHPSNAVLSDGIRHFCFIFNASMFVSSFFAILVHRASEMKNSSVDELYEVNYGAKDCSNKFEKEQLL